MQLYLLPGVLQVSMLTHLFTLFLLLVGIFPPAGPHAYPPIHSFSSSSGLISSNSASLLPTYLLFFFFQWVYFLQPDFTLTHLFTLFLFLVGIFPPAGPHTYPPIHSFSVSSGYISSNPASLLPTYSLFFCFQWVYFLLPTSLLPTYSLFFCFQWVNFLVGATFKWLHSHVLQVPKS